MKKETARKMKNRRPRRNQAHKNNTSASPAQDDQTFKRPPDRKTKTKQQRAPKSRPRDTSENERPTRKRVREDGEGPPTPHEKKRGNSKKTPSSSKDTVRETNSSLRKTTVKRKPATDAAGEGAQPQRKRTRKDVGADPQKAESSHVRVNVARKRKRDAATAPTLPRKRQRKTSPARHQDNQNQTNQTTAVAPKPRKRQRKMSPARHQDNQTTIAATQPRKRQRKTSPARHQETQHRTNQATKQKTEQELGVNAQRAAFTAKYQQEDPLGAGGCGAVFAGYRKSDKKPVAIKRIPKDKVYCKHVDNNGQQLSVEVAIMMKLAADTRRSVGSSVPVALLDWYDLKQELILVLERPVPAVDLFDHLVSKGGSLPEDEAKIILKQLVDGAKHLEEYQIFHRDIKTENILIETGLAVPRARLIDFGLSCFDRRGAYYRAFFGTLDHTPPEFYKHRTYRAGPTTVWQLGVVLYDLLHKKEQFETTKFLKNRPRINKQLSKRCQDFLQSCLARAPEHRPTLDQLQRHPWLR